MIYYITIFVFKCYGILWTVVNDLDLKIGVLCRDSCGRCLKSAHFSVWVCFGGTARVWRSFLGWNETLCRLRFRGFVCGHVLCTRLWLLLLLGFFHGWLNIELLFCFCLEWLSIVFGFFSWQLNHIAFVKWLNFEV